ncbi:MAG: hypothetical protein OEM28_10675 [Nitrosopumilus sp.]|nr:hypothetical protein [Nitrosopumilus sp.]
MLFLIGFTGTVFASENLFYSTSSFEKLPTLVPNESQILEIKFQYQDGPYSLNDLQPIIDVSPKEATHMYTLNLNQLREHIAIQLQEYME